MGEPRDCTTPVVRGQHKGKALKSVTGSGVARVCAGGRDEGWRLEDFQDAEPAPCGPVMVTDDLRRLQRHRMHGTESKRGRKARTSGRGERATHVLR